MKLLTDVFPVILFFIAFKLYGIYVATAVAMAASIIQVGFHWIRHRKFVGMQLTTMGLIVVLGGATLFFHNEVFIKWKPTALNWIFAAVFVGSNYIGEKPIIERMLAKSIELPKQIWGRLNMAWVMFFIAMGFANLYVAYNFDDNTWVNFKLFGVLGLTLLFAILQAIYLAKHGTMKEDLEKDIGNVK